jgi:hypothetical protein
MMFKREIGGKDEGRSKNTDLTDRKGCLAIAVWVLICLFSVLIGDHEKTRKGNQV